MSEEENNMRRQNSQMGLPALTYHDPVVALDFPKAVRAVTGYGHLESLVELGGAELVSVDHAVVRRIKHPAAVAVRHGQAVEENGVLAVRHG